MESAELQMFSHENFIPYELIYGADFSFLHEAMTRAVQIFHVQGNNCNPYGLIKLHQCN